MNPIVFALKDTKTRTIAVAMAVFVAIGLAWSGSAQGVSSQEGPTTTTKVVEPTTTTTEEVDQATGLPVVDGGDPANPTPGSETNQDSRSPVVRDGEIVTGWNELNALLGSDQEYVDCVNRVVPNFNWERDIETFSEIEADGQDTRFILAVNTTASDEEIRRIASEDVAEDVTHLEIFRVSSIINTRGFKEGRCQEFLDRRSMVRVTLGVVVFNDDGSIKGLAKEGGVLVDCHNPWRLPPPTAQEVPPTTVTTGPPSTTTTTKPPIRREQGKDHTFSPVSDDPNDPCEACRPNTAEPPRETPPTTTDPNPDGGEGPSDSGWGATNTTTPPTTTAPPATAPPAPPNDETVQSE